MKKNRFLMLALVLMIIACVLCACDTKPGTPAKSETDPFDVTQKDGVSSDSLYVTKVDNLADDFVMGMDASSVISLENSGVKYYDYNGEEEDVFKILADNGINTIRVRVWNNPYDANGNGYGGGNCDIETAVAIGKRANKYGMNLMVNFHYSDFWADPSKQMVPLAWKNMEIEEKCDALYEYTKASLERLKEEKIRVSMVQVGNETNGAMCGEKIWFNIALLMGKGCSAIREVYPNALIVLHFANPEKVTNYSDYAFKLDYYKIDYDVFASSYYPYWHGTLDNLSDVLSNVATTYGKKVMVAETSYAFTDADTDFYGNTIGAGAGVTKNYPFTLQGQANSVRDVIECMANTTNGIGVVYWEGTWISVGGESFEENSALWEQYGSGWASSYATAYDPNDAGKYYGGCAVDNQAFFDENGHVLESLKVFALAHTGNVVDNKVDALEDVSIICDLNEALVLPTKVNAIMLDDSKQAIDVTWDITDAKINQMYSNGVQKYDIVGTAGGMTCHCYVSMVEKNFIANYSFEDDANKTKVPSGWSVTDNKSANELWVEDKVTDSLTGDKHFHFWASGTDAIDFDLEQTVADLSSGKYKYSISIMGGDCGDTNVYAYVKINGVEVGRATMKITSYGKWDTVTINDIEYTAGDEIVVGIHVECKGSGNGAWGKIDDALLNSVSE